MAYRITQAASFLYDRGVYFHETGTLTKNGVKLFDYYKADSIDATQKAAILKWCKDARFFSSSPEYAPELRRTMICFPKAGFYRVGFSD